MAESANPIVNRFFNYSHQPVARQLALLLGLAASIALGIGLVQWGFAPAYKPLYGSMNGENTNGVISALEANGFDYRLDPRTGMGELAVDLCSEEKTVDGIARLVMSVCAAMQRRESEASVQRREFLLGVRADERISAELVSPSSWRPRRRPLLSPRHNGEAAAHRRRRGAAVPVPARAQPPRRGGRRARAARPPRAARQG